MKASIVGTVFIFVEETRSLAMIEDHAEIQCMRFVGITQANSVMMQLGQVRGKDLFGVSKLPGLYLKEINICLLK